MTDQPTFACGSCLAAHQYAETQLNDARREIRRLEAQLAMERGLRAWPDAAPRRAA